ncbi:MAG TPA: nucleotide-binding protein [Candidatus Angelobacter sp.]|nr:nucleotide-binding protein [Candidatus Angelobacter sp.]
MSRQAGQWYQDGEWWIRHDKTTKSLARLRVDGIKALQWGINGLFSRPEWKDPKTLRITSGVGPDWLAVVEGLVTMEEGQITSKLRFRWPFVSFLLEPKVLADVGTMCIEVAGTRSPADSKEIFIVHGHSETAKSQLKSLLSALGLQPVILSEQTHRGRTVIEELEHWSATCSFAFVLMTPDDIAGEDQTKSLRRARQNVILELGWFMGKLGRENVILISQGDIELPSDVLGVLFLPYKNDVHEVAAEITRQLRDVGML